MPASKISEMILEAFPVASFVIDTEHRVINWNKACEVLTGVERESIVGTRNQWQPFYSSERMVMADLILHNPADDQADRLYPGKLRRSTAIPGTYEAEDYFPSLGENGRWLYFTAAPLRDVQGKVIGAIETLQDVTDQRRAEAALKESEARFKTLSRTDSLTSLYNFRDFYEQLDHEIDRAARYVRPLCLAIIDIDHFKSINDRHGHVAGDRVLRRIGELILNWKRSPDKAFRYGGDEFAVLMPEARGQHAVAAAERLLRHLAADKVGEDEDARCTLSIGVAEYLPGEAPIDLVQRTDAATYRAKQSGRNKVVHAVAAGE